MSSAVLSFCTGEKMDPIKERQKTYECCPLKGAFTITARHSYNILRNHCVGISIRFRAQTEESVAESTRNRFDYQIWQIGSRKTVYWPCVWLSKCPPWPSTQHDVLLYFVSWNVIPKILWHDKKELEILVAEHGRRLGRHALSNKSILTRRCTKPLLS